MYNRGSMRKVLALLPVLLSVGSWAFAEGEKPAVPNQTNSFAVVELFTSEGCSSCPPADEVLSAMVEEARRDGRRVYPLSFHVDYWDRLGWRDPFSDHAFTLRQQAYARQFRSDRIYTPQMVVNGRVEFVGSDRKRATREVESALKEKAGAALSIAVKPAKGAWVVEYTLSEKPEVGTLHVAVVERGLATRVERGENGGRVLRHENVVRGFRSVPLEKAAGAAEVAVPADVVSRNASVVAYVQDGEMHIVAAAGVDVEPVGPGRP